MLYVVNEGEYGLFDNRRQKFAIIGTFDEIVDFCKNNPKSRKRFTAKEYVNGKWFAINF